MTGFTLVEVLVSMTILLMMMLIITQVIGTAQQTWRQASTRLSQFREARTAFDTITRGLSQATLNPYRTYDYGYGGPAGIPKDALQAPVNYVRTAELGLVMGSAGSIFTGFGAGNVTPGHAVLFQAPLGYTNTPAYRPLNRLLCVRGYFVYFSNDIDYLPQGLAGRIESKSRFRLYEYQPTTETDTVYTANNTAKWTTVQKSVAMPDIRPVAENIVTLIMAPSFESSTSAGNVAVLGQTTPAANYAFNSYTDPNYHYHLPTSIQVVMIAMDEGSAVKLAGQFGNSPPQLFSTTFITPATLFNDLKQAREAMLKLHINFRIFSSVVSIPAADN
ncbi:MAG: Verru Chthon cassette protein [Verrucomicrobiaceae bacterium]|nr:Verru Chthon cassette protein [Verrucomicrobiaceae bacterium]